MLCILLSIYVEKEQANSSYYLPPLFLIVEEDLDVDLTGFVFLTDVERLPDRGGAEELLVFPSSLYVFFVSSFSLWLPLLNVYRLKISIGVFLFFYFSIITRIGFI